MIFLGFSPIDSLGLRGLCSYTYTCVNQGSGGDRGVPSWGRCFVKEPSESTYAE